MSKYDELFLATTDTITGLGALISENNKQAIFALKKRSQNKSLVIMVGSLAQAQKILGWNQKAEIFAQKYWPGAITLVINPKLAIRMPKCHDLCSLLLKIGPVYMTSANISNKKNLSLETAKMQFHEIKKYYDLCKGSGKPSTIIDINTKEILR